MTATPEYLRPTRAEANRDEHELADAPRPESTGPEYDRLMDALDRAIATARRLRGES